MLEERRSAQSRQHKSRLSNELPLTRFRGQRVKGTFDVATNTWSEITNVGAPYFFYPTGFYTTEATIVSTGTELLFFGPNYSDGYIFTP